MICMLKKAKAFVLEKPRGRQTIGVFLIVIILSNYDIKRQHKPKIFKKVIFQV